MLGQEASPKAGGQHAEFAQAAKTEELDEWGKPDVCEPRKDENVSKQIKQTRRVLTGKMADGRKSVKARLAAKDYRGPSRQEGAVGTSGRASLLSSQL